MVESAVKMWAQLGAWVACVQCRSPVARNKLINQFIGKLTARAYHSQYAYNLSYTTLLTFMQTCQSRRTAIDPARSPQENAAMRLHHSGVAGGFGVAVVVEQFQSGTENKCVSSLQGYDDPDARV